MAQDILSHVQKEQLREHLRAFDVPIETTAQERFFGATVMYLLGWSFEDTHRQAGGHEVHGAPWSAREGWDMLVSVHQHQDALEQVKLGYMLFSLYEMRQIETIIGYLLEKFRDELDKDHAHQLQTAVKLQRERLGEGE